MKISISCELAFSMIKVVLGYTKKLQPKFEHTIITQSILMYPVIVIKSCTAAASVGLALFASRICIMPINRTCNQVILEINNIMAPSFGRLLKV
jgi:hypothetical protein